MSNGHLGWIANFIWGIADDVLRDVYVRGKYRDVILPMVVIRRLDAILESTKESVLKLSKQLDESGVVTKEPALCKEAGELANYAFYNDSPFTLSHLRGRGRKQQLQADFENYLDGFSSGVQEILEKFKFRNQIPTLMDADALGALIEKFLDPRINLSPHPVYDNDGNERLPGLDNHGMGTIFEELIRRFNEENNEEAGEHWTPRDVVRLMSHLIFWPVADDIESATYCVYDGACGTGGMLTVAEETLDQLAQEHGKNTSIHLFGQEINPETYAIAKADLLLKGEGRAAQNIAFGSTLSRDAFLGQTFDFMLSNPPYGKSWKTDLDRMGGKKDMSDPRFQIQHGGDPEFSLLPRTSDGQLLFLVNKLTKMNHETSLGSRIAEVHNGSSLFTGDAGQGESNIRRWIVENDWLEAIIALPLNMFYNTGIATYIWVLTNRKPEHRQGKVQLIDATELYQPLRKNMGSKNCELSEAQINQISDMFLAFKETEKSKIFQNEAFGYCKVTVERPLRLRVDLSDAARKRFAQACQEAKEEEVAAAVDAVAERFGPGPHLDYNAFLKATEVEARELCGNVTAKREKLLRAALTQQDDDAEPVIKKTHSPAKVPADPLHGIYDVTIQGKARTVEYEQDTDLRDTEQVPLLEDGGVEAFFKREVLPYVPDAWIDETATKIGYEISFTRHFYKPPELRSLDEIKADLLALEQEGEGLLEAIVDHEIQ
ncbi:MAG: type I restriction-modification system subunit M [Candidatus Pacebacteria bacterium]|nr:type I restriction-modification system subunit M [Candidatus Paceibacterota bacterium]